MTITFTLTDEQLQISDAARRFVDQHAPLGRLRAHQPAASLWPRLVSLGWPGIALPEHVGGLGLGVAELALVAEQLGRQLVGDPLLPGATLYGSVLASAANVTPDEIAKIATGARRGAVVGTARGMLCGPIRGAVHGRRVEGGVRLSGRARHVVGASGADEFVFVTEIDGAQHLVRVDAGAGVALDAEERVDSWTAATVGVHDLWVPESAIIARDLAPLTHALVPTWIGAGAYALGAASHAFELTVAYVKTREQFGVAIGTFQAIQHRLAIAFARLELARSAVMAAARAFDAAAPDASKLASLAKAKACDALELVAKEGIQMHGGVGMTDEYDIGRFLKAHRGLDAWLGDSVWHRARWASLTGY